MNDLDKLLHYDSLHEAEQLTGKDYKEDDDTTWLGMALHIRNSEAKRKALAAANDTHFSIELPTFKAILAEDGFELISQEPWDSKYGKGNFNYIYWQDEKGILLHFTSWNGDKKINGGGFDYNVELPKDYPGGITSSYSGAVDSGNSWIFAGNHDCREGMRYKIRRLEEHGKFIVPWIKPYSTHFLMPVNFYDEEREKLSWDEERKLYKRLQEEGARRRLTPRVLERTGILAGIEK